MPEFQIQCLCETTSPRRRAQLSLRREMMSLVRGTDTKSLDR